MEQSNYNITEMAVAYFGAFDPANARRRLNYMMRTYPELWEELQRAHYHSRQRVFTPKQYELVVRFLGEP